MRSRINDRGVGIDLKDGGYLSIMLPGKDLEFAGGNNPGALQGWAGAWHGHGVKKGFRAES